MVSIEGTLWYNESGDFMYNVFKDSIVNPKGLLEHRNKSGGFAFLYFVILTFLMSINAIVFLLGYPANSPITSASTGCSFVSETLVCEDSTTIREENVFGTPIYFFNEDEVIPITINEDALVFQGQTVSVFVGGESRFTYAFLPQNTETFDSFFGLLYPMMRITVYLSAFFQNGLFFLFIVLISTMSFLRLKRYIPYKKIFRLVLFASTPMAVLLTFYNLLALPEWAFFLLMFVGYRSIFVLQRELYFQTMVHLQEEAKQSTNPDIPETEGEVGEDLPEPTESDDSEDNQ
jgi:hypothetical protein